MHPDYKNIDAISLSFVGEPLYMTSTIILEGSMEAEFLQKDEQKYQLAELRKKCSSSSSSNID